MERICEEIIKGNLVYLVEKLDMNSLYKHLYGNKVFSGEMIDDIKAAGSRNKQAQKMCMDLTRRGPNAYKGLIKSLEDSEQTIIVEKLKESERARGVDFSTDIKPSGIGNLEKTFKEVIRNKFVYVVQTLEVKDLYKHLIVRNVFTDMMIEDIQNEPTRQTQAEMMLMSLGRKPISSYKDFLKCLEDTDQQEIVAKLRKSERTLGVNFEVETAEDAGPSESESHQEIPSDDLDMNSADNGSVTNDSRYPIDYAKKRYLLIINNVDFKAKEHRRSWSDIDANKLEEVFGYFGFKVIVELNVDSANMLTKIKDFLKHPANADVDSIAVALLSHGGSGDTIYGSDEKRQYLATIEDLFSSENAPHLIGKPKLLIVQACRGEGEESLMESLNTNNSAASLNNSQRESAKTVKERLTQVPDMVVAHSTCPGFASWGDEGKGSWFIQSLCDTFFFQSLDKHVLDLLTRVNEDVSKKFSTTHLQIPRPNYTITKDWFLTPL